MRPMARHTQTRTQTDNAHLTEDTGIERRIAACGSTCNVYVYDVYVWRVVVCNKEPHILRLRDSYDSITRRTLRS